MPSSSRKSLFLGEFILCLLSGVALASADVTLPALFSDHAVLLKGNKVPVWGTADPGEQVTVGINGATAQATADTNGKWQAVLDLSAQPPGPFDLTVNGKNQLTVHDVVIGEVWICAGQSNMAVTVKSTLNGAADIAASSNPMLRDFRTTMSASAAPSDKISGKWIVASPATTGSFTAVGYYFGKQLQQALNTPVGLIDTSVGGTPVKAWISAEGIAADPSLVAEKEKFAADVASFPARLQDYAAKYRAWEAQYQRQDAPVPPAPFADPSVSTADWTTVKLPGPVTGNGLPASGAIWLRRTFDIPASVASTGTTLYPGTIHDFDTVYWNGVQVGASSPENPGTEVTRRYQIHSKDLRAGPNVMAIRIFNPVGGFAVDANRGAFVVGPDALAGEWQAKAEKELPPLDAAAKAAYPQPPNAPDEPPHEPTYLFNGIINPIIPVAMRGVVWYQGENDAGHPAMYEVAFPRLITDWRAHWGRGDFPFYFCQLPGFGDEKAINFWGWAPMREAQAKALALPATGMAVLADLGEEKSIHPRNKAPVGDRLARIALAQAYQQKIVDSGPTYTSMDVEGATIRIKFDHTDGGLVAQPIPATYQPNTLFPEIKPLIRKSPQSQLEGFIICGEDQQWKYADATIDGVSVVVSSPEVAAPVAVRYAWSATPLLNLTNGAGLPAAPFRTDDYPLPEHK